MNKQQKKNIYSLELSGQFIPRDGATEKPARGTLMASFAKISCTFVNCLAHCGDAAVYDLTAWKAAADGKPYWTGIGESTAYFSVCSPLEATCGASPATSPAAM